MPPAPPGFALSLPNLAHHKPARSRQPDADRFAEPRLTQPPRIFTFVIAGASLRAHQHVERKQGSHLGRGLVLLQDEILNHPPPARSESPPAALQQIAVLAGA